MFFVKCFGTDVCKKNCASDELDCYILDNNGFTLISEKHEHTGKFFGDIDGTIMDSLVQDKIFRKVSVVDYQGVCFPQSSHTSDSPKSSSCTIWNIVITLGNFVWTWILNLNFIDVLRPIWAYASINQGNIGHINNDNDLLDVIDQVTVENQDLTSYPSLVNIPVVPVGSTLSTTMNFPTDKLRTCEKKTDLYILQPDRLNASGQSTPLKGKLTNCNVSGCERSFSVQKISYTNLILLAVDTLCPCGDKKLGIKPYEALTDVGACVARRERLYRRRPCKCINYHPEEMEIKACDGVHKMMSLQLVLFFICLFTICFL